MESVSGNRCIYCMFISGTLLVFLVGVIDMTSGVYVCIEANTVDWYNGGFVLVGFTLIVLALVAAQTRSSYTGIGCYLLSLIGCFLAQLGFTLGIILYSDYEHKVGGEANADIVRYILVGTCGVIGFCLMMGCCYRSSLGDAEFTRDNELSNQFFKRDRRSERSGRSESKRLKEIRQGWD